MKRILSILFTVICGLACLQAQTVGLVLSGGGAKGIAHIGIIKALEENNVPIDYVAGTSMGAIVGAWYAMGYTPDEMLDLILSEDFNLWSRGIFDKRYVYYFKKPDPTPEIVTFNVALQDSTKFEPHFLPNSLINPFPMNYAFMSIFAPYSAQCEGNFDNLFVPFRAVASDVYHKREVILRNGDLGDAVRASMSFPFVFKPIEIDSVLVYDGGIYNNFPVDVMKSDFNPDIIIGSIVAAKLDKPKEDDLMNQIENMVMQKSDYTLDPEDGILMRFNLSDVGLLDFPKARQIAKIGYDRTIAEGNQAKENFVSEQDGAFYANMYRKDRLKGGHIILLNPVGSEYYEADVEQAKLALSVYPGGLQVGGGITDANAAYFLEQGASHVVVTSFVFKDGKINYKNLESLVKEVGREHLVLDLSCRKRISEQGEEQYFVVTDRWQKFTDMILEKKALKELSSYCDEFLIHAVDVEGKANGVEKNLVSILSKSEENTITYAGGVGSFSDLEELKQLGKNRINVTIGSALDLFGGTMDYAKVLKKCRE